MTRRSFLFEIKLFMAVFTKFSRRCANFEVRVNDNAKYFNVQNSEIYILKLTYVLFKVEDN